MLRKISIVALLFLTSCTYDEQTYQSQAEKDHYKCVSYGLVESQAYAQCRFNIDQQRELKRSIDFNNNRIERDRLVILKDIDYSHKLREERERAERAERERAKAIQDERDAQHRSNLDAITRALNNYSYQKPVNVHNVSNIHNHNSNSQSMHSELVKPATSQSKPVEPEATYSHAKPSQHTIKPVQKAPYSSESSAYSSNYVSSQVPVAPASSYLQPMTPAHSSNHATPKPAEPVDEEKPANVSAVDLSMDDSNESPY